MNTLFRAFLSHSTRDKSIVRAVAEHLGRAAVIYDEFEFKTGDDFKTAIVRGLGQSDLFVLFASKNALSRDWVRFEIESAEEALASQALSQVVTYIIDPHLNIDDLPDWMRATLISRLEAPGLIALDIRRILGEKSRSQTQSYFVGRQNELSQALDHIAAFHDPNNRPPLVIYGLTGIGRRTLLSAIGRDHLSLSKLFIIELEQGDLLPEVLLKVSTKLSPDSIADPIGFINDHSKRPNPTVAEEIVNILETICSSGSLPVFVERDAMPLQDGSLRVEYDLLYNEIAGRTAVDAAIISNRRLSAPGGKPLTSVRVPELPNTATKNLLRLIARDYGLSVAVDQIDSLATYSRGYPPAIGFAISEARIYGISHVVANQHALVNFSAEIFLAQITDDRMISASMCEILRLLSSYSPLPLAVIQDYCNLAKDDLVTNMEGLLDFVFVLPEETNYRISEPIRDAAYRAFGGMTVDHTRVARLLAEYLADEPNDDTRLSLGRSIFRASLLSRSSGDSEFSIGFASDFIRVATQSYHDQDYDLAIRYGEEALEYRSDNVDVRRYVAQALIRKERYEEATVHIDSLVEAGHLREAFYVKGFQARRRREYREAILNYEKCLAYGRRGAAIHRELASCYFESGNDDKAEYHIGEAERSSPHNRFIVDLRCTIAIRIGDLDNARRTLEVLDRVDSAGFADHRRSTFEQAQGNPEEALLLARRAIEKMQRPPFEVVANLVNCLIEAGEDGEALNSLGALNQRFRDTHHDAQTGLRCKYEIRFGDVVNAEGLWNLLREKDTPVHKGLRISILNRKLQQGIMGATEKEELEELIRLPAKEESERMTKMLGSLFSQSSQDE